MKTISKKDRHKIDLVTLFNNFPGSDAEEKIENYLVVNSNLPGRRGNLELAAAFAEIVAAQISSQDIEDLWKFCYRLTEISSKEAPVNTAKEFLPFCGTRGLGALGAAQPKFFSEALIRLHILAIDPRWRMREAVPMAIQQLLTVQYPTILKALEEWVDDDNWLVLRAVAASVAEPELLTERTFTAWALVLHKKIFTKILSSSDRTSEEFKALRKGLGYTLSVVIRAIPVEGFNYLQQLVATQDKDIIWIIKQNLKKKRLTKHYPKEVKTITKLLS